MSACDTCAFGKSGAAKEPRNRLVSNICALTAIPFHCHHTRSGPEFDWSGPGLQSSASFLALPPAEKKVCEGWKLAVRKLKAEGQFNVGDTPEDQHLLRRYLRSLGADALRCLEYYLAEKDLRDKEDLRRQLKDLIRAMQPAKG